MFGHILCYAGGPTQAAATSRPPLVPVRPRAVDGPEAA